MRSMDSENIGETLVDGGEHRIHLCGRLTVRLAGLRLDQTLPGRQGRMLFAYLMVQRARPTPRAELYGVLWPESAPVAAESALAALLAKLRRAVGAAVLTGKQEIRVVLPEGAWVDIEAATEALHRAESAVAQRDWAAAWGPARVALHIAARAFMPGYEAAWIGSVRRRMEEVLVLAHECVAASGTGIGGAEVATAERSARCLVELAPYRESGYRFLMQALALRDNIGEALMVYEQLRRALRDELGAFPGAATQALHARLLRDGSRGAAG